MDRCIYSKWRLVLILIIISINCVGTEEGKPEHDPETTVIDIEEQFEDSAEVNKSLPVNTDTLSNEGNNTSVNISNLPSHKWPCKAFNITETPATVVLNNETDYTDILAKMNTTHGCGLLLFYSPYCEFCTNFAPLYNAIGRSYPELAVMAVDTLEAMGMAARYGVVGIPSVFFFYSGKPVSRYNRTRTAGDFEKFIKELAGYNPTVPLNVTAEDMDGPIITTVKESRDNYMIFSVTFLSLYLVSRLFGSYILNAANMFKSWLVSLFSRKAKEE